MACCKTNVDILKRLGGTHKCDRQTDEHSLSKCRASLRCAAKDELIFPNYLSTDILLLVKCAYFSCSGKVGQLCMAHALLSTFTHVLRVT